MAITVAPGAGSDGECFFLESSRPAAAVAAATHDEGDASPQLGAGQTKVVYLDFDGEDVDVTSSEFISFDDDGVVTVPPFAESLARAYPTLDPAVTRQQIIDQVTAEYAPFDVLVTDDLATAVFEGDGLFERLFIGGDASIFGIPLSISSATLGIAEVDPGNPKGNNIGFILVENYPRHLSDSSLAGQLMGVIAAHEFGHEFGLQHIENEQARMYFRIRLNVQEIGKTWLAGLLDDSFGDYQDSSFVLSQDVGLNGDPFPADTTPDDLPDNALHAQASPMIADPTTSGPVAIRGRISGGGDVDVVRFVAGQSGPLTVTLEPVAFFSGVLAVTGPNGNALDARSSSFSGNSVQIAFETLATLTYYVYVNGLNGTNQGEYDLLLCATTGGPPTVTGVTLNNGDAQRSQVTRVEVTFDGDVDADLNSIVLTHLGVNAPQDADVPVDLSAATIGYVSTERQLTIDFSSTLADGFYELRLSAAGFRDCAGVPLDGDDDGIAGGDFTTVFHRFAGDFDGDADVDLADHLTFQACHSGAGVTVTGPCSAADLDFDGDVDLSDQLTLLGAFTGSVPHVGP